MTNTIYFCSEKPEKYKNQKIPVWTFSNWYKRPYVGINKIVYSCTEQEMMHQKALVFNDVHTANLILKTNDPKEIKQLGRQIKGYKDEKWAAVRVKIVQSAVREKFNQYADLQEALLATGDMYIAEAADYDRIWGIGYSADTAEANKDKWGQNLLGEILMLVRKELKVRELALP